MGVYQPPKKRRSKPSSPQTAKLERQQRVNPINEPTRTGIYCRRGMKKLHPTSEDIQKRLLVEDKQGNAYYCELSESSFTSTSVETSVRVWECFDEDKDYFRERKFLRSYLSILEVLPYTDTRVIDYSPMMSKTAW